MIVNSSTINELTAQRTDIAVFFDVTGYDNTGSVTGDERAYTRAGTAWTSFTESPNAQTKERKFINEKTARSNITSYKPQWAFEVLLMYNRPEIAHIYDCVKRRVTGSELRHCFIVVDLFDQKSDGVYAARQVYAVPQISSIDDDDDMIMKGTFYNQGDEILGTFNMASGVFTQTADVPEIKE